MSDDQMRTLLLIALIATPSLGLAQPAGQGADCSAVVIERMAMQHRMPNVEGCLGREVVQELNRTDHRALERSVHHWEAPDRIVSQSPAKDTELQHNTPILLDVSDGSLPPPSKPSTADVSVQAFIASKKPFLAGEKLRFAIRVANAGPATATGVAAYFQTENLKIFPTSGECSERECRVVDLQSGANATLDIVAGILGPGPFSFGVTVRHAPTDPDPRNDSVLIRDLAEPRPAAANLGVSADLQPTGPYHVGERVTVGVLVRNGGPQTATNVTIEQRLTNLQLLRLAGDCRQVACVVPSIPSESGVKFELQATVSDAGEFSATFSARGAQQDLNSADNSATVRGTATAPDVVPPNPSVHTVRTLLEVLGACGLAGLGLSYPVRIARWRSRIRVRAALEGTATAKPPSGIRIAAPAVSLRTRLERGVAKPHGTIPIINEEVRHD